MILDAGDITRAKKHGVLGFVSTGHSLTKEANQSFGDSMEQKEEEACLVVYSLWLPHLFQNKRS